MSTMSFRTVRHGVSLVYFGLLLVVLSFLLAVLLPIIAGSLRQIVVGVIVVAVVRTMATAMGLVGIILCLAVPDEAIGKRIIYVAVILQAIAVLIGLTGLVMDVPAIMNLVAPLLSVTALVLFLVFLRQLALHLQEPALAEQASNVLRIGVAIVITFVAIIILFAFALFGGFAYPPLSWAMMLVAVVLGLTGLVLYGRLLSGLRCAMAEVE